MEKLYRFRASPYAVRVSVRRVVFEDDGSVMWLAMVARRDGDGDIAEAYDDDPTAAVAVAIERASRIHMPGVEGALWWSYAHPWAS